MSVVEPYELVFEPQQGDNVLQGNATYFYDPSNPTEEGDFLLHVTNGSKTWVSVVVQTDGGHTIFDSGNFDPGDDYNNSCLTTPYRGQTIKIVRWAPDIVDIPGDGGGEVLFTMPNEGSLSIDLTVVSD